MSTLHAPYSAHAQLTVQRDPSPITELLEMIERRAPLLMRVGGGSLGDEQLDAGVHLSPEKEAQVRQLFINFKSLSKVAQLTGVSYGHVCKLTHSLRGGKRNGPRRSTVAA